MFSSCYQSGSAGVEVFSPVGTDTLKCFSASGGATRTYQKEVKGFVYTLMRNPSVLQCGSSVKDIMGE